MKGVTQVPTTALDSLKTAFDLWWGDEIDDADLIDALGDFIEEIGGRPNNHRARVSAPTARRPPEDRP